MSGNDITDRVVRSPVATDSASDHGHIRIAVGAQLQDARDYGSPLPLADEFQKYESVYPGAARAIIEYMNREQAFRHDVEKEALKSSILETQRGQIFAFILMILLIATSLYAATKGYHALALLMFGTAALSVIRRFLSQSTEDSR